MRKISDTNCRNCPVFFEPVAVIPLDQIGSHTSGEKVAGYTDTLEKGYRYHYKVRVNPVKGAAGKDSNTIVFQY